MESIASKLKTRRESLNISLEQVSRDTRISVHHLISLENSRYDDLPGGMYNRAILRAYCDAIGLDKDECLQYYDDEIAPYREEPVVNPPVQQISSSIKFHTAVLWSIIFLLGIGLFLNRALLVSALSPYFSSNYVGSPPGGLSPEQQPASTNTLEAYATNASGSVAPAVSRSGSKETAENLPVSIAKSTLKTDATTSQSLRLEIVGTEECWLSIDRDDSGAVTKILSPGDIEFFTASRTISLIVGNAGGVSLRINDRSAKTLGESGQVVRLTIDKETLSNLIDPSTS